jgi:hypothetical protein
MVPDESGVIPPWGWDGRRPVTTSAEKVAVVSATGRWLVKTEISELSVLFWLFLSV